MPFVVLYYFADVIPFNIMRLYVLRYGCVLMGAPFRTVCFSHAESLKASCSTHVLPCQQQPIQDSRCVLCWVVWLNLLITKLLRKMLFIDMCCCICCSDWSSLSPQSQSEHLQNQQDCGRLFWCNTGPHLLTIFKFKSLFKSSADL